MAKVKNKKTNSAEAAVKKRNRENKKTLNPFEVHINRDKQKVLGRKNKADRGLPGVARAKALNKRKNTLLLEYKHKDKDNIFMDRRIGEKNASMTQEERSMARFAAERIKSHRKKDIFSLNDEEVLTHGGQTLEEIEKFEDPKSDDEYSDEEETRDGRLDKKFVSEAHFGGGILSKSDGPLSRKELIDQLIFESKKRKAEKQKVREQTIDLTEKLDSEWKDLLPLMASSKKNNEEPVEKTRADDYDIAVRELKYESRATPSDKLKSEEEIMHEEKEKLEELEQDRLARMKGFTEDTTRIRNHKSADDLDDDFAIEDITEETLAYDADGMARGLVQDSTNVEERLQKDDRTGNEEVSEHSANDEEDNQDDNSDEIFKKVEHKSKEKNATKKLQNGSNISNGSDSDNNEEEEKDEEDEEEEEEGEEEEEDDDDLSDLKVSESSSDEEESQDKTKKSSTKQKFVKSDFHTETIINEVSENCKNEERIKEIRNDLQRRKLIMEKARQELPYTYSAPETFEEFETLIKDHNPDYQSIILERIVKCNHWTLGQGNREKLCKVFDYLLQYIVQSASVTSEKDISKCFQILDRLCPHLYDLAQASAQNTATCVQNILRNKHDEFEINRKKYPGLETLILFKIISLLFPTSDFRHPVVTPSLVFMSQILLRCRIKTRRDIAKGLFVCALMLEYTLMSKRFSPAVINYLRGVIYLGTPKPPPLLHKTIPPFKSQGETSNLLILEAKQKSLAIDVESPCMRCSDLSQNEFDDDFRLRAFVTALNMTLEFKRQFEELEAVHAIFFPIIKLLQINDRSRYPKNVKKHVEKIRQELESLAEKKLEFIVREKKKPKALRLYEPRIERVYDGKKHRPMSREKADREKLLHKIKKETKSAIREVRRDRAFLAKVQIKQQIKSDTERKRKVKEILSEASVQQGEFNEMKRKKGK
ncbi:nucleolar protein 14 homolog [Venturia canescens]|uniref:nucleolar protein 14 homolog n=1 Tax=Venturia canescens TaxID=32260 RepID=UPI001C9C8A08|nr:nucleolar protein 14 homolog [Venturia canescens]